MFKYKLLHDHSDTFVTCLKFIHIINQYIIKHFFLFLLATSFNLSSFGQLKQNTWLVGGSGSFYSYNENYTSTNLNQTGKWTNIDLSASGGYFFVDKLCGGIRTLYSSSKKTNEATINGGTTVTTSNQYYLSAGPYARYYFLKQDKQFNILTDVGYQFGVNKYLGAASNTGKYNIFSAKAGIEAFFNSTAGIEILIGYYQTTITIDNTPSISFIDTKKGFQVSIGFQLHLIKE